MRSRRSFLLSSLALLLPGCGVGRASNAWKAAVANQTEQLGYRNWIVVAEASFPAQSRPGVHQVPANVEIPEALDHVLASLERTQYVNPQLYLTRELGALENDYAPGIDEFRKKLTAALHAHETTRLDQSSLITLLDDANRSFDVLVIRTTTALPYTSVFIELQPGYWDSESERRLRERMQRSRMDRISKPL